MSAACCLCALCGCRPAGDLGPGPACRCAAPRWVYGATQDEAWARALAARASDAGRRP